MPRYRRALALLVTLAAALIAACGSPRLDPATSTVIPARMTTPTVLATPSSLSSSATTVIAPSIPTPPNGASLHCQVSDLIARWEGASAEAGGYMIGRIAFANVSAQPCVLRGIPTLSFFDASYVPILRTAMPCTPGIFCPPAQPLVLPPVARLPPHHFPSHPPGGEAFVFIGWQMYKPEIPAGVCAPPITANVIEIRIQLPNSGEVLPLQDAVMDRWVIGERACNDQVSVSPFTQSS